LIMNTPIHQSRKQQQREIILLHRTLEEPTEEN